MEKRVNALEEELETITLDKVGLEGKMRSQERQSRATHARLLQELESLRGSYQQFIELSKTASLDMSAGMKQANLNLGSLAYAYPNR